MRGLPVRALSVGALPVRRRALPALPVAAALLGAVAGSAAPARAQVVVEVVDAGTGAAVVGAIVNARGAADTLLWSGLTDGRGRVVLPSGAVTARVERIGYEDHVAALPPDAGGVVRVRVPSTGRRAFQLKRRRPGPMRGKAGRRAGGRGDGRIRPAARRNGSLVNE